MVETWVLWWLVSMASNALFRDGRQRTWYGWEVVDGGGGGVGVLK